MYALVDAGDMNPVVTDASPTLKVTLNLNVESSGVHLMLQALPSVMASALVIADAPSVFAVVAADVPYTSFEVFFALTSMVYCVFEDRPVIVLVALVPAVVEKLVHVPLFILYSHVLQLTFAVAVIAMESFVTVPASTVTVGAVRSRLVRSSDPLALFVEYVHAYPSIAKDMVFLPSEPCVTVMVPDVLPVWAGKPPFHPTVLL